LDRCPQGIPPSQIVAFTALGIRRFIKRQRGESLTEQTARYLWAGREFGRRVVENKHFGDAEGVYAFKTAALEILREAKNRGVKTILEQPNVNRHVMHSLLKKEHQLHPAWEKPREEDQNRAEEWEREQKEWEKADVIICPSEFVRESIRRGNGPVDRTAVVPYGVDFRGRTAPKEPPKPPLRILTVGRVSLRKGAPYLLKAAKCSSARFRMVGEINLQPKGKSELGEEVELLGQVPRSEIHKHYEWADVFVLPSICEGSATVVYEALAHALPVICTPNTGSIVEDGKEGFIIPIRQADPITDNLEQLASDPDLYWSLSKSALRRYRQEGTLEAYGERLTSNIHGAFER
jgi:glycosyltransferase involved in cell wall biosynthesis